MRERGILFSAPMVRALLAGTKTQTRRLVGLDTLRPSGTPGYDWTWRGQAPIRSIAQQRRHPSGCWQDVSASKLLSLCPQGAVGDRLWVRETYALIWRTEYEPESERDCAIEYRADGDAKRLPGDWPADMRGDPERPRWRPSIFMPRWASRITREITEVRVERLQDISEADAQAEGVELPDCTYVFGGDETGEQSNARPCFKNSCPRHGRLDRYRLAYRHLWDAINGKRPGASWDANPWVWAITMKPVPA